MRFLPSKFKPPTVTVTPQYCKVMDASKVENIEVPFKLVDLEEYISRIKTRIGTQKN